MIAPRSIADRTIFRQRRLLAAFALGRFTGAARRAAWDWCEDISDLPGGNGHRYLERRDGYHPSLMHSERPMLQPDDVAER